MKAVIQFVFLNAKLSCCEKQQLFALIIHRHTAGSEDITVCFGEFSYIFYWSIKQGGKRNVLSVSCLHEKWRIYTE